MTDFAQETLRLNGARGGTWVEPFAGGGGLALSLLGRGAVGRVVLNDTDDGVRSFWEAVLNEPDRVARDVATVPLTVAEWDRWRAVRERGGTGYEAGFAAFYLNRTNRGGVIDGAGVIGGRAQRGAYGMACRFPRAALVQKVRAIAAVRDRVEVRGEDGVAVIVRAAEDDPRGTFLFVDPPYWHKGPNLYGPPFGPHDHARLASALKAVRGPWIATYDRCEPVSALYRDRRVYEMEGALPPGSVPRDAEVVVVSKGMAVPDRLRQRRLPVPGQLAMRFDPSPVPA